MKPLISTHHMKSDSAFLLATLMLCGLLGTASISLVAGDTDGVTGLLKVFWQTAGFGWSLRGVYAEGSAEVLEGRLPCFGNPAVLGLLCYQLNSGRVVASAQREPHEFIHREHVKSRN